MKTTRKTIETKEKEQFDSEYKKKFQKEMKSIFKISEKNLDNSNLNWTIFKKLREK